MTILGKKQRTEGVFGLVRPGLVCVEFSECEAEAPLRDDVAPVSVGAFERHRLAM
jgi:hypothetical protein